MNEGFPYSEIGLSNTLGVSRTVLRNHRNSLKNGVDFVTEGKTISWSKGAAAAFASVAGVSLPVEPEKPLTDEMVKQNEVLEVVRNCVNPFVLMGMRKNREVVTVRVTSNKHFRPGMELRAELTEYGWTSIGRTPRFVGRW